MTALTLQLLSSDSHVSAAAARMVNVLVSDHSRHNRRALAMEAGIGTLGDALRTIRDDIFKDVDFRLRNLPLDAGCRYRDCLYGGEKKARAGAVVTVDQPDAHDAAAAAMTKATAGGGSSIDVAAAAAAARAAAAAKSVTVCCVRCAARILADAKAAAVAAATVAGTTTATATTTATTTITTTIYKLLYNVGNSRMPPW
mmetsp:Transcript_37180/g.91138  ORF Transcript_37180/g.91138 Transcript_37180/m.91138 type:complete len:199 (+) Transcript_37180:413-1009(+)